MSEATMASAPGWMFTVPRRPTGIIVLRTPQISGRAR